MDDLFRFVSVRPAQTSEAKTVSIQGKTPFQDFVRSGLDLNSSAEYKWQFMVSTANEYTIGAGGDEKVVQKTESLAWYQSYANLRSTLADSSSKQDLESVQAAIMAEFKVPADKLHGDAAYDHDRAWVWDSILLIFLVPRLHRNPFNALIRIAQVLDIIRRAADGDTSLNQPTAVLEALSATVILPPDLLPEDTTRLRPVGIADLLVVKQHINRYELGEIVNIENILRGESRKKNNKHVLTNERTVVMDTTTTTETVSDLTTSERFSLKREAEKTVKEDINAKAGVNVSAKYGTAEFSANASFDYSNFKQDSQKVSSDYAKDVTSRASIKVTESIRVQQTTRILETFEEEEDHTFDNTGGTTNVSGIYQWLNKVYTTQVFNYGKRLLFDIMVPEPAALILDAGTISATMEKPKPPVPFTMGPDDFDYYKSQGPGVAPYYGDLLTQYDVQGVEAPPVDNISVAKTFTLALEDKATNKGGIVQIPEGYEATRVCVDGMYNYSNAGENGLLVFVADLKYEWKKQILSSPTLPANTKYVDLGVKCGSTIGIAVECWNTTDYAVLVEVECKPTTTAMAKWRLETHTKILAAYEQKLRDYQDELVAQRMSQPAQSPLGNNNPDANRMLERTELKRGALQLLTQQDLLGFDSITEDNRAPAPTPGAPLPAPDTATAQHFPRPTYAKAIKDGQYARFFEQAFEWEQMQYVFYPYYWSRKSQWYDKLMRTNVDPLFAEFLKAGQARVVIPVRPSMEPYVWYYLMTGQVWMGGDPPMVTDGGYLSIAEEIKERSGAQGDEAPYGPSWEVVVPTSIIKLRNGESIDDINWTLSEEWKWTPKPEGPQGGAAVPQSGGAALAALLGRICPVINTFNGLNIGPLVAAISSNPGGFRNSSGEVTEIFMGLKKGTLQSSMESEDHPESNKIGEILFKHMLKALDFLQTIEIIYRDLKPENMLFVRLPNSVFGVSNCTVSAKTFASSPLHMTPEVFHGGKQTPAADFRSLYVTVVWVLDVNGFRKESERLKAYPQALEFILSASASNNFKKLDTSYQFSSGIRSSLFCDWGCAKADVFEQHICWIRCRLAL
ncbi:hypothetical protein P154DRAFT_566883 [Amniculicola lignicola CBS 123094]|uniref:Protein kinase domain-containing protein n=1 Tax=Amniculicola lignicola CBS 123094 TaxID=1392246 RepID=A0A6A5W1L6_9PLEO|nr:hypothetical protein P154DRAFT_566883 [Amniculicola lignicola CBS 123094]